MNNFTHWIVDVTALKEFRSYGAFDDIIIKKPYVAILEINGYKVFALNEKERDYTASFKTASEAHDYFWEWYDNNNLDNFVYVVRKNSDLTEGRGPMKMSKVFRNYVDAREHVLSQTGVQGRPVRSQSHVGINIEGGAFARFTFTDHEIDVMELE